MLACVGGGSNAIGLFHPFIADEEVRLIGVEAGGRGDAHGRTCRQISPQRRQRRRAGRCVAGNDVLRSCRTITAKLPSTHSISAGLDYPAVGPEHAFLHDNGRAEYIFASDADALEGFKLCAKLEGITPALETSHVILPAIAIARELPQDDAIIVNLSGRGDKDVQLVARIANADESNLERCSLS